MLISMTYCQLFSVCSFAADMACGSAFAFLVIVSHCPHGQRQDLDNDNPDQRINAVPWAVSWSSHPHHHGSITASPQHNHTPSHKIRISHSSAGSYRTIQDQRGNERGGSERGSERETRETREEMRGREVTTATTYTD